MTRMGASCCPGCAERDERIRELEAALEGAVYLLDGEPERVAQELGLTPQQGQVVVLLWRARRTYVRWDAIDQALPPVRAHRPQMRNLPARADPEFRSESFGSTIMRQIRRRLGDQFVESRIGQGYRLSPRAQEEVGGILDAARKA